MRRIINHSFSSCLILEDDADWDIALKPQLMDIARGTRFLASNTTNRLHPFHSPYGDHWDLLWLGHCGGIPSTSQPTFRLENDPTVPLAIHIPTTTTDDETLTPPLPQWAPNGTRLMFRPAAAKCALSYAVSARGAPKIVAAMKLQDFEAGVDGRLAELCERGVLRCVQVFPPIFGRWERVSPAAKRRRRGLVERAVVDGSGDLRKEGHTRGVAYSVQWNLERGARGLLGVESQFPDMPVLKGPIRRVYEY